jgi:retron-type reverse transcriptase
MTTYLDWEITKVIEELEIVAYEKGQEVNTERRQKGEPIDPRAHEKFLVHHAAQIIKQYQAMPVRKKPGKKPTPKPENK